MSTHFFLRSFGLLAFIALLGLAKIHAQSAEQPVIGLHVNDLTSGERDAIARDLADQGEMRVSFACVPAGILVLEPTGRSTYTTQRHDAVLHTVRLRIPAARISEEPLTMTDAEARCAEARDR